MSQRNIYKLLIVLLVIVSGSLYYFTRSKNIITLPNIIRDVETFNQTKPQPTIDIPKFTIIDEAQQLIEREPHDKIVAQAKRLLKKREELQKSLDKVNKDLKDLEDGKEVVEDTIRVNIGAWGAIN